jgi:hypothetical protein
LESVLLSMFFEQLHCGSASTLEQLHYCVLGREESNFPKINYLYVLTRGKSIRVEPLTPVLTSPLRQKFHANFKNRKKSKTSTVFFDQTFGGNENSNFKIVRVLLLKI